MNATLSIEEFDCNLTSETAQKWNDCRNRLVRLCDLQKYVNDQKLQALFLFG